ncbi:MAG TPA: hypothetical protein VFE33_03970 [Thermoanaerobaculia bacterium]|nr:hypothetical protein [Thermoanaerobaculia bacterium]
MLQDDYERYRKRLEEQLHADIGLLYDAFHAKLRAYQAMVRSRSGELAVEPLPPSESPVPAPAPAVTPALQASRPRSEPVSVIDALREVLPQLPENFDKLDVLPLLGFEPRRSTFYEALNRLTLEGVIDIVRYAGGKRPAQYRKVDAAS